MSETLEQLHSYLPARIAGDSSLAGGPMGASDSRDFAIYVAPTRAGAAVPWETIDSDRHQRLRWENICCIWLSVSH